MPRPEGDEVGGDDKFRYDHSLLYHKLYLQISGHRNRVRNGDAGVLGVASGVYLSAGGVLAARFDEVLIAPCRTVC